MPAVPWRFSRCCAALLALLISAIGGFRTAVDHEPAARFAAVAVVRDLAGLPVPERRTSHGWQAPGAPARGGGDADTAGVLVAGDRAVPAPTLLCGSAQGPRAP